MGIPKYELNKRPLKVAVDQEYNPNSTNAQSGVAVAQALAAIAPAWSQQAAYNPGDLVMRNGKIWRALHVIASGTSWAAADWEEVDLNDFVQVGQVSLAEEITYSALVALRNGGNLVPGKWYRITDYRCSTLQAHTLAAGNAYDILVRADDESHLNENAFAAHHEGDTYFQNCKLENWQLKYCLDNDTDRFAWADDVEGKGVIFYMKDEWGNECPYDFKNIKFQRWAVTADQDHPSLVVDNADNNYGYYYGAKDLQGNNVLSKATYGEDTGYFYTFALKDLESGDWFDYTVAAHLGLKNDEGNEVACYDNHLIEATDEYGSGKGEMAKMLNNIVFFNCYGDLSDTSYSDDYSYCNNNRFLGNCHSNTFGNSCYRNSFGNYFQYNSFGNGCNYNSFGNNNTSNSFGNGCNNNSFGNYCNSITVFDGVKYCSVSGGSADNAPVKNAQILNGTAGASAANKLTIAFTANASYTQVAAKDSSGNLQIWNPADNA